MSLKHTRFLVPMQDVAERDKMTTKRPLKEMRNENKSSTIKQQG